MNVKPKRRRRRRLLFEPLEDRRLLAIFTVNNLGPDGDSYADDGICDTANNPTTDPPTPKSNICTLRAALDQAFFSASDDTIKFAIDVPAGVVPKFERIIFANAENGTLTVDGTTQEAGMVEIHNTGSFAVLLTGGGHTIKGLVITGDNSSAGIRVRGDNNTIVGNIIGIDPSGAPDGHATGIEVVGSDNRIGGTSAGDGNVISGNSTAILIRNSGGLTSNNNLIMGNFIGTDATGTIVDPDGTPDSGDELGNDRGIQILAGHGTRIGGATEAERNVISGNAGAAIDVNGPLDGSTPIDNTTIQGNLIGTDVTGTVALGNGGRGVQANGVSNSTIAGNVISANMSGISFGPDTTGTQITGNMIGTDLTGSVIDPDGVADSGDEFGNREFGIRLEPFIVASVARDNTIGGPAASDTNVISGNRVGISLFDGADENTIQGNLIGTNAAGTMALGNGTGIEVLFSSKNVIAGNTVSGNTTGIEISGSTATDNLVVDNRIGVNGQVGDNPPADAPLANETGVLINDAPGNCIGGTFPVAEGAASICAIPAGDPPIVGNLISGNSQFGIQIANANAANNVVQGNKIGTDASGQIADPDGQPASGDELGNGFDGVFLRAGAHDNTIGGTIAGKRNIISGNLGDGVLINGVQGSPASENLIIGNFIGTNVDGDKPLPNLFRGIHIDQHSTDNIIGGGGTRRNVISANGADGIIIFGTTATGNVIRENLIGTDLTGNTVDPDGAANSGDELGNQGAGVFILDAPNNLIGQIGENNTGFFRNTISGNAEGIRIEGTTATGNVVEGNLIGTNVDGDQRLKNEDDGIHIVNAPDNRIGTTTIVAPNHPNFPGNIISGNGGAGVKIEGSGATGNLVGGNMIGTSISGKDRLANIDHGVFILGASGNRIGTSLPGEPPLSGNTISGNFNGIRIDGVDAKENLIGGNLIGTDFEGNLSDPPLRLGNNGPGVHIRRGSENFVGGLVFHGDGQATQLPENTIAANLLGVQIAGDEAIFNKIQRNSIFENRQLGIDLGGDGITPNDDQDVDASPNKLQNYPVDLRYTAFDGMLRGKLNSVPEKEFKLDLYKSPLAHPSGHGEGKTWVDEFDVETDVDGNVDFAFPVILDPANRVFTMTATDLAGNTSEFSPALRQPDLSVDPFSMFPHQVTKEGAQFFFNYNITVRNEGTGTATRARFEILGNGQPIPGAGGLLDLDPDEVFTFSDKWEITQDLQGGTRGIAALEIIVRADPDNLFDELDETNNSLRVTTSVDGRPVISNIEKEFAEGVFLEDIELDNTVQVFVDWNGDLDGVQISNSDQPRVLVRVNGAEHPPDGDTSLSEFVPTEFTFQMGSDLSPGENPIEITAQTRLYGFESDTKEFQYDQIETVAWIDEALWGVKEIGGPSEKIAEYSATVFFPTAATIQGFFDIPVDRVGLQGGAFGPKVPQFAVNSKLRSDRSSMIDAEMKLQGEVADKDFGGIESALLASLTGEFDPDSLAILGLKKLEGTLGGEVLVMSPKVRMPGILAWLRMQGTIGFTVDATIEFRENPQTKGLELHPDIILGLEPTAAIGFSTGYGPVTVEVSYGGTLRGDFSLAQDPCLLLDANATLFVTLKSEFAIFEVTKTLSATVDIGGCGSGESEGAALTDPKITTNMGLIPRYVLPASEPDGEDSSAGLPTVLYPYAKPALARNDDGTMTLIYVDEDPTKPDGQHLEVFSSHYDGATWSPPVQISNDTLIDDAPTVTYDANGNAVAMWSRFKNTLTDPANTDPLSLLDELEIVTAVWDADTQTWGAPTALTDNAEMDFLPRLQADAAGNVMAIWLRDADNDTPIFPDDETQVLGADYLFATWDGAAWSAPAVAVAGVMTNEAPEFAIDGANGVLVWSEDGDGIVATDADREIRTSTWDGANWSAASLLDGASDDIADVSPRVIYDSGRADVVWTKTGVPLGGGAAEVTDQLVAAGFSGSGFSTPALAFETEALAGTSLVVDDEGNLIAVWQATSDSGPDVFYAVRDALSGDWSEPIQFTDDADLEWWFNPFINDDGELEILHLSRELGSQPAPNGNGGGEAEPGDPPLMIPTFDNSSLATAARQLGHDLAISRIALSDPNPAAGSTAQVTVSVQNAGDFATPPTELRLTDDGSQVGSNQAVPQLAAGRTVQLTFDWLVPAAATPHTLTATVDPADQIAESDEANNAASIVVLRPDLVVDNVIGTTTADKLTVTADVINQGAVPAQQSFDVALRLDDAETGATIATSAIAGLAAGERVTVTYTIDDPFTSLGSFHVGFIVADVAGAVDEVDETNNDAFGAVNPFLSWQNVLNRFDVNNDQVPAPGDVLRVINAINRRGPRRLPAVPIPPFFLDVNGDGFVTPADALAIISFLNAQVSSGGTGEGEARLDAFHVSAAGGGRHARFTARQSVLARWAEGNVAAARLPIRRQLRAAEVDAAAPNWLAPRQRNDLFADDRLRESPPLVTPVLDDDLDAFFDELGKSPNALVAVEGLGPQG